MAVPSRTFSYALDRCPVGRCHWTSDPAFVTAEVYILYLCLRLIDALKHLECNQTEVCLMPESSLPLKLGQLMQNTLSLQVLPNVNSVYAR